MVAAAELIPFSAFVSLELLSSPPSPLPPVRKFISDLLDLGEDLSFFDERRNTIMRDKYQWEIKDGGEHKDEKAAESTSMREPQQPANQNMNPITHLQGGGEQIQCVSVSAQANLLAFVLNARLRTLSLLGSCLGTCAALAVWVPATAQT